MSLSAEAELAGLSLLLRSPSRDAAALLLHAASGFNLKLVTRSIFVDNMRRTPPQVSRATLRRFRP
jgi:hypothetical protein